MRNACLILALATAFGTPAPALADPVMAGYVRHVEHNGGKVWIVRGGAVLPAAAQSSLYNHDQIRIDKDAYVCLDTARYHGDCFNRDASPIEIVSADTGEHRPQGLSLLRAFLPTLSGLGQPSSVTSRGDPGFAHPILPSPLLPFGLQKMPSGYRTLAPLWSGAPADSLWATKANPAGFQGKTREGVTFSALDLDRPVVETAEVRLKSGEGTPVLAWTIAIDDAVPGPNWLDDATLPLTTAERTERAAWILKSGPGDWRLFALTELALLERSGSFEAGALLDLARSPACGAPGPSSACAFLTRP